MRHSSWQYLILSAVLAVGAVLVTAPGPASALGGSCGGAVPCACGDELMSTRTLVSGVDPITTTICPGSGLVIATNGVALLGAATLRGSGVGVGIDIHDADGVTIQNVRVTNFRRGIRGTRVRNTTLSRVQALGNAGDGITLEDDPTPPGSITTVDACIVKNNGGAGVSIQGSNTTVSVCRIESNGGTGLTVDGTNNDLLRNIVYRSGGDGIHIAGSDAVVDRNQAKYNAAEGFLVEGVNHTLTRNISASNGTDGYTVTAATSRFELNTASYNGRAEGGQPADGYGIRDTGSGNSYVRNNCTGNGLGNSLPAGLCN